jgi:hypothetical protein
MRASYLRLVKKKITPAEAMMAISISQDTDPAAALGYAIKGPKA